MTITATIRSFAQGHRQPLGDLVGRSASFRRVQSSGPLASRKRTGGFWITPGAGVSLFLRRFDRADEIDGVAFAPRDPFRAGHLLNEK